MDDFCRSCRRVAADGHEELHWICADCRVGEPTDKNSEK
jgi:hypothetical protein